jgi:hypothetical protein
MTGKGCVYRDAIDRGLEQRARGASCKGFMLMPFRENLEVFFRNTLIPFFESNYAEPGRPETLALDRADQVRRPGIIICEGICKRIQESDFVVADISVPNDNVFYELGLAYGIGQKVLAVHHHEGEFGIAMAAYFRVANLQAFPYIDLNPIRTADFPAQRYVWRPRQSDVVYMPTEPEKLLLFYEHVYGKDPFDGRTQQNDVRGPKAGDIRLSFRTHVMSNVGLAIERIFQSIAPLGARHESGERGSVIASYRDIVAKLREPKELKPVAPFLELKAEIDACYCMIVRTGKECHPMAYFWLGYGHGLGKNIIPITVVDEGPESPDKSGIDDLAFDIRAQRHMTFVLQKPHLLEIQIKNSLRDMIYSDLAEWSRKRFWDKMLGKRGQVSIFTGALHHERINREMIGDWDLRAVSELTAYFSRHQYRASIETPIYSPEYARQADSSINTSRYIAQLREMMQGKNCVLIASPDVNPLTEIILGHIYGVGDGELFTGALNLSKHPKAMVVVKQVPRKGGGEGKTMPTLIHNRAFYVEEWGEEEGGSTTRGFRSGRIPHQTILKRFISQQDLERDTFEVYAHLVIVPNPYVKEGQRGRRYIIVLNGVSGPATFALTHVLTGGVNEEFVSYPDFFDPEAASEEVLREMLKEIRKPDFKGLESIAEVRVGPAKDSERELSGITSDWRRILGWDLESSAFTRKIQLLE